MEEVGYVLSSRDYLIYLDGLPNIRINDLVENETGARGWVNAVFEDKVEVLLINYGTVSPNMLFRRLNSSLGLTVGEFLLGRAINPLGIPIDGKKPLAKTSSQILPLDAEAPPISARDPITSQLVSGISLIDTLLPLGKGQRELVIGDAHSGKTAFLIDLIVNQKNTNTICIVGLIGKPISTVRNLIDTLKANKAMSYTTVIASSSAETSPLIFLTAKTAFSVAEYFAKQGKDVLLILDDLGIHAKIYREIALLSDKTPGRDSYPADIFYQHARLLERAGNFKKTTGGGSITALPVIEINLNDFTTFVPTNLMATTDGHLLFKANLHNKGQRPSVDIPLSVSRVGRQTQIPVQNQLSLRIRRVLAEAEKLTTLRSFSPSLPPESLKILQQRDLIELLLKHEPLTNIPIYMQVILSGFIFTSLIEGKNSYNFKPILKKLIEVINTNSAFRPIITSIPKFKSDEQLIKALERLVPSLKQPA